MNQTPRQDHLSFEHRTPHGSTWDELERVCTALAEDMRVVFNCPRSSSGSVTPSFELTHGATARLVPLADENVDGDEFAPDQCYFGIRIVWSYPELTEPSEEAMADFFHLAESLARRLRATP